MHLPLFRRSLRKPGPVQSWRSRWAPLSWQRHSGN